MSDEETPFQKAVRKRREAAALVASTSNKYADLIPPDNKADFEKDDIDRILENIGIIEAYNKWCGKSRPSPRPGQTESIMVRCPIPGHVDKHPDAWLNTKTNEWFCGPCNTGGGIIKLAAIHFGYGMDKVIGSDFMELRKKMAESFGYVVAEQPGGAAPIAYLPAPPPPVPEVLATVTPISADVVAVEKVIEPPQLSLDWRTIVKPDTFLDIYMKQCIIDDAAEEYHFWNGLMALGLAVGREVTLFDSKPVYANLLVCLLGKTGDRKSRSFSHASKLIAAALKYDPDMDFPTGVRYSGNVASGEALINIFCKPVMDPVIPKRIVTYAPVRGIVNFEEFSALAARASRPGNTLKDTIISFYDAASVISTNSMTHKEITALDPFCSIFATTQPESLKGLMTQSDTTSGFLNRWIFASGTSKKIVAVGGAQVDIEPAIIPLQQIHDWSPVGGTIEWNEDALKLFFRHFETRIEPDKEGNAMLARLDLLEKKIILLLCINEMSEVVTKDIVERMILMHEYIIDTFRVPAQQAGMREENEIRDELLHQVERITSKNPKGATWSSIQKAIMHKNWPDEAIRRKWEQLIKFGEVEEQPKDTSKKSGRPAVFYKIATEDTA